MYIVFDGDRQIGHPVGNIGTAVASADRLAQASPRSEDRDFHVTHVGAGDVYSTRSCGPEARDRAEDVELAVALIDHKLARLNPGQGCSAQRRQQHIAWAAEHLLGVRALLTDEPYAGLKPWATSVYGRRVDEKRR